MSSWTIVEFVESSSVEAVPTKWLKNNEKCFWPTIAKNKLLIEIKNCQSPNVNWPLYQVRIFKDGTYDDYATARKKAKKAEETSDLNSDVEIPRKRKIFRKLFSESSDTDEEVEPKKSRNLPSPPKLKLTLNRSLNNTQDDREAHSAETISLQRKIRSNPGSKELFHTSVSDEEESTPLLSKGSNDNTHFFIESVPHTTSQPIALSSASKFNIGRAPSTTRPASLSSTSRLTTGVTTPNTTCQGCEALHTKFDALAKLVNKTMSSVRANYLQIREDLETLANTRPVNNNSPSNNTNFFNLFNFPLTAEDDLEELSQYLQDEENFKHAVKHMVKLGGKDTYDFIRRCFQHTLSDSLAKQFTFDGTKEKRSIKEVKIGLVILDASREHNGADLKASETAIRKWLRRASERHQSKSNSSK